MSTTRRSLTVFISSPSDVLPERVAAERVVARLDRTFSSRASIRAVRWEHEPLRATGHFQDDIPSASQADIVVVILWSRLGSLLSDRFRGAISGRRVTGTEFEFEDALAGFRANGRPDVLVYRKLGVPPFSNDEEVGHYLDEKKTLIAFIDTWLAGPEGPNASRTFRTIEDFEESVEEHLRELIARHLGPAPAGTPDSRLEWPQSPFRGLESFEIHDAPIFSAGRAPGINSEPCSSARRRMAGRASSSSARAAPASPPS